MKQISIIIPCYNVELYIDRCFESLQNQTLGIENMELVFINDASTDGTLEKLMTYERQYPESVMVIPLEENRGQGAARNIGLQYVSADYIGFVDSDDWVDANMFEEMLQVIRQQGCDFVECEWDFFSEQKSGFTKNSFVSKQEGFLDFSQNDVKERYVAEQLFFTPLWTKLFKKSFLEENAIFCPEGLKYEDMYFCFLAILYAKSYYHMNCSYYHYFLNPNGTVQQRTIQNQLDMKEVSLLFLETCRERGLYDEYKDIVEWMFLEKYYIYMIWDIWDIVPDQAYDWYVQLKETVQKLVPDYGNNPFRQLASNQLDDFILKLLDYPLQRSQFDSLIQQLKAQQDKRKES
jgi:glycosyltransferase involved in cell wall biosynthesis